MSSELVAALKKTGKSSLLDWAEQFPKLGMVELAQKFPIKVPPIRLVRELAAEARTRGSFADFARAWMVRVLNAEPDSITWGYIFDDEQAQQAKMLWARVESERKAKPKWLPQSGDDARLLELFSGVELSRSPRTERLVAAFARIDDICESAKDDHAVLRALAKLPPGYGFLHAVRWVDAEVSNGGFEQLYRNNHGVEVPLAIEALRQMKRDELSAIVAESLAFAHAQHPELVDDSIDVVPKIAMPRTWAQLDQAWYALPRHDLYATLLDSLPHLFEPPFTVLKHADGRAWKVRANGAQIEIHIILDDGHELTRERKEATPAAAQREVHRLIEEQLRDGFVVS